jgi:glycosyltransferase involved in cell wall biosynthesis
VVYVGSFARYQGMSLLIEAIPRVLDANSAAVFLLVGAASQAEVSSTLDLVPNRLVDRVRIVPRVDRAETPDYLALADVLVSARIHGDNAPLKAFDYLVTAKPIVASDIPAHRALFDEGVALLAPPTPEGFSDAICRVLEDDELSKSLAAGARVFSEEHLIWERFVERVDEIIQLARRRT